MTLYHGGKSFSPKVAKQKEIGIHVSPSTEEARLHFQGGYMSKCDADVSNSLECRDLNNWASLDSFIEILRALGVADAVNVATDLWRENQCRQNTIESSKVIRDYLLDCGVDCIYYIDEIDLPGTPCYILLRDQEFHDVRTVEEGFPNFARANDIMQGRNEIIIMSDGKPYYTGGNGFYKKVPNNLFLASPKEVASSILKLAADQTKNLTDSIEVMQSLIELIQRDYPYDTKSSDSFFRLLVHSDSIIDSKNPGVKVDVSRKSTSIDNRVNAIELPGNKPIEQLYETKVKPFIDASL